jgi:hypothetical protein
MVYSMAICLWEVLSRRIPYPDIEFSGAIVNRTTKGIRPDELSQCPPELAELMKHAWAQDPTERPTAAVLHEQLTELEKIFPSGRQGEVISCLR